MTQFNERQSTIQLDAASYNKLRSEMSNRFGAIERDALTQTQTIVHDDSPLDTQRNALHLW